METKAIHLTYVPGTLEFRDIDPARLMSDAQLKRIAKVASECMRPKLEGGIPRIEEYLHHLRQQGRSYGPVEEHSSKIHLEAKLTPYAKIEPLLLDSFEGCYRLQRYGSDSTQHEYGLYGRLHGKLKLLPLKIVYQDARGRTLSIQYPIHGDTMSVVLDGTDSRCQFFDALARLGLQTHGDGRYHHSDTRPDLIEARLAAAGNPNDFVKATTFQARNNITRHCRKTLQLHTWYSHFSEFFSECTKVNMSLNIWNP